MKQLLLTGLILWKSLTGISAQEPYLGNDKLMSMADNCIHCTYGFQFPEARIIQQELDKLSPGHPAPPFLEALIIYWENFPLLPDDPQVDNFIDLMSESVERAEKMLLREELYLEGSFFDLFGRAFQAMFWADNGRVSKAAGDLPRMYRRTREGFGFKEEFAEYYFSTGLYNYYIEAYPEAHPIYKPLVSFMQEGDRELGLRQLETAISKSTFLQVEATLFMALIQLNYEKDLNTAALYAERLNLRFPDNLYYQGLVMSIWLHQHRYGRARELLKKMESQTDIYSLLVSTMARAFLLEKSGQGRASGKGYQEVIDIAEGIGPLADMFKAMAYMGLSRLHSAKGLHSAARRYARKAEAHTPYAFILEEL